MSQQNNCACSGAPKLIFACSGASDVGAIADQAARKLSREGAGRMYCLAGIGGRISGIVKTTQSAAKVVAIDGCPLNCAQQTLLQAGFTQFEHIRLADLGLEKGKSPMSDERVEKVAAQARQALCCE